MQLKYHEEILRHAAQLPDGKSCEILERRTFERSVADDGTLSAPRQINCRFDLRTGERVKHLGGDAFELDLTGEPLTLRR